MRTEMLAATDETLSGTVTRWLGDFEKALRTSDDASLEALFRADAHWRDLLVFGWQVRTVGGARRIVDALKRHAARAGAAGFEIDPRRTPPRRGHPPRWQPLPHPRPRGRAGWLHGSGHRCAVREQAS